MDRAHQRFVEQQLEAPCVVPVEVWRGSVDVLQFLDMLALFSRGNLDIFSTSSFTGRHSPSCSCESLRMLLSRFSYLFYVKMNVDPEVDPACSFHELLILWWQWSFFSGFTANFRTPSIWTSSRRPTVVGCRGLKVAGTPGV